MILLGAILLLLIVCIFLFAAFNSSRTQDAMNDKLLETLTKGE